MKWTYIGMSSKRLSFNIEFPFRVISRIIFERGIVNIVMSKLLSDP